MRNRASHNSPAAALESLRASLRFHAAAGARVALRNSVIGTMVAVFVLGSAPQPPGLLRPLANGVAGADASPWSLTLVAMLGAALARQALPQLSAGHAGWMRSLPASDASRRRALAGALVMAQAPLVVFLVCAWVIVLATPGWHVDPVKLVACMLILLGAAMLSIPVRGRARVTVIVPSLLAIAAATTASGVGLAVSLLSLVVADRVADGDSARAPQSQRRRTRGATLLPYRIAWRAISWRVIGPLVYATLPVGFAWLMCVNNQMIGAEATTVMRTGGTLGVVVTLAGLASVLQLRRPTWAWARSLPTSSAQRVWHDAGALLAAVVPIWIVVAAVDVRGALAVVAVSPLVALLSAAAMRRASARITGAQGEILALGVLIVVAVSRSWWLTLACIVLTPAALLLAVRRERTGAATQWSERHHSTVGDAIAWTAP